MPLTRRTRLGTRAGSSAACCSAATSPSTPRPPSSSPPPSRPSFRPVRLPSRPAGARVFLLPVASRCSRPPFTGHFADRLYETALPQAGRLGGRVSGCLA